MMRLALWLGACLCVAACSGPACLERQNYHDAEAFPPLQAPPGLTLPEPDPNFEVPAAAGGPVGAYPAEGEDADDDRRRCLESPPTLSAGGG